MKKVYFYNKQKEKLAGILHLPKKISTVAVIICHGYSSSKDNKESWAEAICNQGFAVLRFDFSGHGESEGLLEDLTITNVVSDLRSALDFLESLKYSKFGVTGHSLGGLVCVATASIDKRIGAAAPVSAPSDLSDLFDRLEDVIGKNFVDYWKKNKYIYLYGRKMKYSFYEDAIKYDPEKILKKITCPLLLVHGDADSIVPVGQSINAFKLANGPKQLEIIKGADHNFEGGSYEKVIDLTANWFKKWLLYPRRP